MILGPIPEPRKGGDWGWSRVTDDPCWVNQYGFGTWHKDRRPWAHCDYVPPGPGWLRPVWCDSETNCSGAYAAARSARFGYALAPLPASASPIEQQFWDTHCRLGLPELKGLVPQYRVGRFRLDFALPEHKIGIELDGLRNHSSTADIERDHVRQRWLEKQGWRITRFGGREVRRDAEFTVRDAATSVKRWITT
jgi:very-short-patch-repair endonuclease